MAGADAILAKSRRIRVPDIAWVKIPAGPFIYEDAERRELPDFWIGKYPITNAQFQTFIDDGGYSEGRCWRDLEKSEPEASRWKQGNRPRTNVNWYEAVAFTRWLTAQLDRPEGSIRLPTEFEWEKAARGPKGLLYPWGNEYRPGFANVNEKAAKAGPWYLRQATAVGLYPHGRSPYGVEDLAGTIWEWCLNNYDKPELTAADGSGDARALRGGSWLDAHVFARAGLQSGSHPGIRYGNYGFRVVSSVPMPDS